MFLLEGYEELLSWAGYRRGAGVLMGVTGFLSTLLVTCLTGLLVSR